MRTLQYKSREKQLKISQETLDIFAPIADRLNMGRLRVELEELAFSYLDPETHSKLKVELKNRVGKSEKRLRKVRQEVDRSLDKEKIAHTMDGRSNKKVSSIASTKN